MVDDEIINLENIRHYLIKLGYSVQVAANGHIAIDLIEKHHFDLVITDLKMDGVDGAQVMAYSKEILPNAEVIIMTGHGSDKDEEEARRLGAFDYLRKPVDMNHLMEVVKDAGRASNEPQ